MVQVRNLGVLSFAKFQAVLMGFLGVLAGIAYSVGGAIIDLVTTGWNLGTALAFLALIGMPVIFAALGFAAGIVEAVLYNQVASRFGGMELRFRPR